MNVSRPGPVYTNSDTFQWEGSSPLIFSEARRAGKKFFFDTAPPFPPLPYLKVWIRHCF